MIPQEKSFSEAFENITTLNNETGKPSPEQEPLMSIEDDITAEDEEPGWWKHEGHSTVSYTSSEDKQNIIDVNESNEKSDNTDDSNEESKNEDESDNSEDSNEESKNEDESDNSEDSNEGSKNEDESDNSEDSNEGSENKDESDNGGESNDGSEGEETNENTGDKNQEIPEFSVILIPFMIVLCIALFFRK